MAKRLASIGVLILAVAAAASAGDVARFINLGFSADSRYFMFGQYGISEKTSAPWAETYIVNMRGNAFVPQGKRVVLSAREIDAGSDAIGALFDAVAESRAQKTRYKINHIATGRLLYILVDGVQPADSLDFRDFETGRSYSVALAQNPPAGESGASFGITVTVTEKDGSVHTYKTGDPSYRRPGVKAYHVKQIILAPDNASLVFLVQRDEQDTSGDNVRFMVETVGIN